MTRLGTLLILALSLSACVTTTPNPDAATQPGIAIGPDGVIERLGRVGPDGTPPALLAERGIGGTGAPVSIAPAFQSTDRGIGGTGIVGVVTGFGSVFVNGIEVEYDANAAIDIDGTPSHVSDLRAGQLVAIQADGSANSPHAKSISVRTAVSGRIEALELGSGMLTVAGQAVAVPEGTWGANRFGLGDWVRISGLRRDDGTVVASRLDAAPVGTLLARGRVVRDGNEVRVGNLPLAGAAAGSVKDGQYVVVSGSYAAGHGQVSAVAADVLWPNPGAYFGPSTTHLVMQAFVRVDRGSVSINGVPVKSAPVISAQSRQDGLAIVSLQRQPDGSYTATGVRYGDFKGHTDHSSHPGAGTGVADPAPTAQRPTHGTPAPAAADTPANPASPVVVASLGQPGSAPAPAATPPVSTDVATNAAVPAHAATTPVMPAPSTTPPVTSPPVTTTPVTTIPITTPPATVTPVTTPPAIVTPVTTPPAIITPVTTPPAIVTPVTPPPAIVTPVTSSGVIPPSKPGVQSVNPFPPTTSQLMSSNGSGSWNRPVLPGVLTPTGRGPSIAVGGSTTAPTVSLLTAAVTSVTTTSIGKSTAATNFKPAVAATASPAIGTTSGKLSATVRVR